MLEHFKWSLRFVEPYAVGESSSTPKVANLTSQDDGPVVSSSSDEGIWMITDASEFCFFAIETHSLSASSGIPGMLALLET